MVIKFLQIKVKKTNLKSKGMKLRIIPICLYQNYIDEYHIYYISHERTKIMLMNKL